MRQGLRRKSGHQGALLALLFTLVACDGTAPRPPDAGGAFPPEAGWPADAAVPPDGQCDGGSTDAGGTAAPDAGRLVGVRLGYLIDITPASARVPVSNAYAAGVTEDGAVAGMNYLQDGGTEFFIWKDGEYIFSREVGEFWPPGLANLNGITETYALYGRLDGMGPHPFVLHSDGGMWGPYDFSQRVPAEYAPTLEIAANSRGEMVGSARGAPYRWTPDGGAVDLIQAAQAPVPFPRNGKASAINEHGTVAGWGTLDGGWPNNAFIWKDGVMRNLGTLGGPHSYARGINNHDDVVGFSKANDGYTAHAVLWPADGGMVDLGVDPTYSGSLAFAINDEGWVAGQDEGGPPEAQYRAVIWKDGLRVNLDSLLPADAGIQLWSARDINNELLVVGMGRRGFAGRAYVLKLIPVYD